MITNVRSGLIFLASLSSIVAVCALVGFIFMAAVGNSAALVFAAWLVSGVAGVFWFLFAVCVLDQLTELVRLASKQAEALDLQLAILDRLTGTEAEERELADDVEADIDWLKEADIDWLKEKEAKEG